MQKPLMLLTGSLFICAVRISNAAPLDSPDTVYIDGEPCNRACQSYMAWSRRIMPVPGQKPTIRPKAAAYQRPQKSSAQRAARSYEVGTKPGVDRTTKKDTPPDRSQTTITNLPLREKEAAANSASKKNEDSASTVGTTARSSRPTFEQVAAAAALVERLTVADSVAIVMARPEIKSISDLAGKSVTIDTGQSALSDSIAIAIANAGGADIHIQLAENNTQALERVLNGETPAAVLTLASPEAAEGFPEIAGFKIFRVPMRPGHEQANVTKPQPEATGRSNIEGAQPSKLPSTDALFLHPATRTTRELIAAATAVAEEITSAIEESRESEQTPGALPTSNTILSRIAIVMARPELKSVSDLAGKQITIDHKQSASSGNVLSAIAAAGATEIRLKEEDQTRAIDRVIGGEVPAAVITLVSPEAAEAFPEVNGFKIFRVPLTPQMPRARTLN